MELGREVRQAAVAAVCRARVPPLELGADRAPCVVRHAVRDPGAVDDQLSRADFDRARAFDRTAAVARVGVQEPHRGRDVRRAAVLPGRRPRAVGAQRARARRVRRRGRVVADQRLRDASGPHRAGDRAAADPRRGRAVRAGVAPPVAAARQPRRGRAGAGGRRARRRCLYRAQRPAHEGRLRSAAVPADRRRDVDGAASRVVQEGPRAVSDASGDRLRRRRPRVRIPEARGRQDGRRRPAHVESAQRVPVDGRAARHDRRAAVREPDRADRARQPWAGSALEASAARVARDFHDRQSRELAAARFRRRTSARAARRHPARLRRGAQRHAAARDGGAAAQRLRLGGWRLATGGHRVACRTVSCTAARVRRRPYSAL
ncbi:hypothetical protein BVI1335_1060040 [Burkholderia vietnamiensis]|nr:hypothetical protein BVI1335_1060040 [Burkholderia vietnamiensis]